RDGRRIRAGEMTDSHLRNAAEYFGRRYSALRAEMRRRGLAPDPRRSLRIARRIAHVDAAAVDRFAGLDLPDEEEGPA
ncbi:MAG: hypothetical protein Q7T33_02085, partial [Dehalococcoidia bacterium]|nr:hypothetical protein [Dehalococcoidia bacterium]